MNAACAAGKSWAECLTIAVTVTKHSPVTIIQRTPTRGLFGVVMPTALAQIARVHNKKAPHARYAKFRYGNFHNRYSNLIFTLKSKWYLRIQIILSWGST